MTTVSALPALVTWMKAIRKRSLCRRGGDSHVFKFLNRVLKEQRSSLFVQTAEPRSFSRSPFQWVTLISYLFLIWQCSPSDYCDEEDEVKALRSRSAASPGEMAPLVTLSSRWGRASLTPGWFWKWHRTLSWIRLHIHTFCWAVRLPCSSPLASAASRYASILAQTSGMPSKVCEEARTTCGWRRWGVGRFMIQLFKMSVSKSQQNIQNRESFIL